MPVQPIYLDFNASTPVAPEVAAAMRPLLETHFGNPSSLHWAGAPAKASAAVPRPNLNMTPPIFTDEEPKPSPVAEAPKK